MLKFNFIRRFRRITSIILALVIVMMIFPLVPVMAQTGVTMYNYNGYAVEYNIMSEWANNQNVQIIVTNTGNEPIYNWALQYDTCGTITGLWNGEVYGNNIIKNTYYNSDIAVGTSVSFGYTLLGVAGTPDDFALCSYRTTKDSGYTVNLSAMQDWGSGFTGLITITNTTDAPIMAWELELEANFEITQAENFSIIENTSGLYRIRGTYNNNSGNVSANSSVTLQFNANLAPNPEITNVLLTEMVISDTPIIPNIPNKPTEYVPWLPEGLNALAAFGFYDAAAESIILEWAYQDNSGDFDIYEGNSLITEVTGERTYIFPVDGVTTEYVFVIRTNISNTETLVSNEVIMRLNEDGHYEFVIIDSDADKLPDLYELILGTDPLDSDTDVDGLPDGYEILTLRTDPLLIDTDSNNIWDGGEDFDNDGLTNLEEYTHNTDPFNADTDNDTLNDYDEVFVYFSNPLSSDSDSDGLPDALEIVYGMNLINPDTLNDGTLDGDRIFTVILEGDISDNEMIKPTLTVELEGKQIEALR